MSVFSLMQFIFAPFWGKLSDRYGRRPILLCCLFGEALSYILLAQARSLEWLYLARILTGFFGASISTTSAYISDITTQEERTKGMALIGAAFGLGFLFGPAIGGGLTYVAKQYSSDTDVIMGFVAYPVVALCLMTFIYAYFFLQESNHRKNISDDKSLFKQFSNLNALFQKPITGTLMVIFGLATLSMSMMEATLVLLMKEKFNWGILEASFGFAYIGVIIVFTQGFLVRKMIPKLGEKYVIRMGISLMALGFILIAVANHISVMAMAMTFLSLGNAFSNPSLLGSISLSTPANEQGFAMGTTQSLSALGRVIGPAIGAFLFGHVSISSPFWTASILLGLCLIIILKYYSQLPASNVKTS